MANTGRGGFGEIRLSLCVEGDDGDGVGGHCDASLPFVVVAAPGAVGTATAGGVAFGEGDSG